MSKYLRHEILINNNNKKDEIAIHATTLINLGEKTLLKRLYK